jgi:hypothetical protein
MVICAFILMFAFFSTVLALTWLFDANGAGKIKLFKFKK